MTKNTLDALVREHFTGEDLVDIAAGAAIRELAENWGDCLRDNYKPDDMPEIMQSDIREVVERLQAFAGVLVKENK